MIKKAQKSTPISLDLLSCYLTVLRLRKMGYKFELSHHQTCITRLVMTQLELVTHLP